ncbi:MAG: hypothetical protein Terrestrivirus1_256 [Terrestrivirus sp.]|uniref:Uncharacterized protein n=1 Tax=Terrestrivirus sp. TaxID=2487775 RepID=A0A3G4ZKL0_9VIRU|nr:MAG: hypothetical protein Terrestrivirus1_256 [Terrestrivirus sp.]
MVIHEQIEFSTNNVDDIFNSKIKIRNEDLVNFIREVYEKFDGNIIALVNCLTYNIIKSVNIKVYIQDISWDNVNIWSCDRYLLKEMGFPESVYVDGDHTIINLLDDTNRLNYFNEIKKTDYKYKIDVVIEFSKLENLIILKKNVEINKDVLLDLELIRNDQNDLHNSGN